jgi:hypothetical protein
MSTELRNTFFALFEKIMFVNYPHVGSDPQKILMAILTHIHSYYGSSYMYNLAIEKYMLFESIEYFACQHGINASKIIPYLKEIPLNYAPVINIEGGDYEFNFQVHDLILKLKINSNYKAYLRSIYGFLKQVYGEDSNDDSGFNLSHNMKTIAHRIMEHERRPHQCLDDIIPCYSCVPISPVSEIIINILKLPGPKQEFDDIVRDVKNTYLIDPTTYKAICLMEYFEIRKLTKNINWEN